MIALGEQRLSVEGEDKLVEGQLEAELLDRFSHTAVLQIACDGPA